MASDPDDEAEPLDSSDPSDSEDSRGESDAFGTTDDTSDDAPAGGGSTDDASAGDAPTGGDVPPDTAVDESAPAHTPTGDADATTDDPPVGDAAAVDYEVSDEEQTWGVLVHISALSAMVVPFGNVLGPLLVWLVKKDESRFVDENGKEALNFQITWTILFVVSVLTLLIGIGLLLVPIVGIAWLVLVVVATLRASENQVYHYPLTVDFVS